EDGDDVVGQDEQGEHEGGDEDVATALDLGAVNGGKRPGEQGQGQKLGQRAAPARRRPSRPARATRRKQSAAPGRNRRQAGGGPPAASRSAGRKRRRERVAVAAQQVRPPLQEGRTLPQVDVELYRAEEVGQRVVAAVQPAPE